jgi:hypothetical protein
VRIASIWPVAITTTRCGGAAIVVTPPKCVIVRGKTPSASGAPIPPGIDVGPGRRSAGAEGGTSLTGGELAHPLRAASAVSAATAITGTRPNTETSQERLT